MGLRQRDKRKRLRKQREKAEANGTAKAYARESARVGGGDTGMFAGVIGATAKGVKAVTSERVARTRVKLSFTPEETGHIFDAARRVWQDIGMDLLAGPDEGVRDGSGLKEMTRAEVIEVVSDAGRLEEALRRETKGRDGDLIKKVAALGPEEISVLLTPAFPHEVYGL